MFINLEAEEEMDTKVEKEVMERVMDGHTKEKTKTGVLTKAPAVALVSSEQSLANSNVIGEIENDKSVQRNKGGSLP